ncbi:MAG: hypothetical protein WC875_02240 [Candidatus Absconditabacterales bacterium]|jgi:uncharacterized membrane protein
MKTKIKEQELEHIKAVYIRYRTMSRFTLWIILTFWVIYSGVGISKMDIKEFFLWGLIITIAIIAFIYLIELCTSDTLRVQMEKQNVKRRIAKLQEEVKGTKKYLDSFDLKKIDPRYRNYDIRSLQKLENSLTKQEAYLEMIGG